MLNLISMMKRIAPILALSPILLRSACAQEVPIPPPKPPFVAAPPEFGSWIIKPVGAKTSRENGADNGAQEFQVVCVKTGNIKRDTVIAPGGRQSEIWYAGGVWLSKPDQTGKIQAMDGTSFGPTGDSEAGSVTCGPTFPGFSWLKPKYYRGVVLMGGKTCFYFSTFRPQPAPGTGEPAGGTNKDLEAWIDVATKYPAAVKADGVVYSYQFQPPPTAVLQLPPEYAAVFHEAEARLKHIKALEPRR